MNVRHRMCVLHLFSIKYFYDKIDLRLSYFYAGKCNVKWSFIIFYLIIFMSNNGGNKRQYPIT